MKSVMNESNTNENINLFEDFNPICSSSGNGILCFGDNNGNIRFINRDLQMFKFQSHSGNIQQLYKTKNDDLLISLGKHQIIPNGPFEAIIIIWELTNLNELGIPKKIKILRVFYENQLYVGTPISSLTCTLDAKQIAIGCATGLVLIFDINYNNKNVKINIKGIPLVSPKNMAPVTGLHYLEQKNTKKLLYVITLEKIKVFFVRKGNYLCNILDSNGGCDIGCSTLTPNGQLVVAKSDTIHIFNREDVRGLHAFPGEKKMISSFKRYLIVIANYHQRKNRDFNRVECTIYDNNNKYISFRRTFDDLICIMTEWNNVFILTKNKLFKLRDKDLQEKLNEFFRNNLYQKAIDLAISEGCNKAKIIEYYCKYGDYLYTKGEFDQAMGQYLQTIDVNSTIEPSYVIRKFLDAQKIKNLTQYLSTLHSKGNPTSDHTTLLLNCYTKLKDSTQLTKFINNKNLKFDIDTAIRVCREAGLLEHARSLAKKSHKHKIYLDILLEEANMGSLKKLKIAIEYIETLSFFDAEKSILRIGKTLIEQEPQQTCQVIKKLCTQWDNDTNNNDINKKILKSSPEDFIHLFVRQPKELKNFLEYLIENDSQNCKEVIYNTLLEIYMRDAFDLKEKMRNNNINSPNNSNIMNLNNNDNNNINNSLDKNIIDSNYNACIDRIMTLLRTEQDKYDKTHALALSKMYGIEDAVIYLYQLLHLFHEIITHYRDKKDNEQIILTCQQHWSSDKSLWINAFTYFIHEYKDKSDNDGDIDDDYDDDDDIKEDINVQNDNDMDINTNDDNINEQKYDLISCIKLCLHFISRLNLLPPLMVIELLSDTDVKLNVIREYIINDLVIQQQKIDDDEIEINKLKKNIKKMKENISDLTTKAKTFQATKCASCKAPLSLPTVHFLCGHSIHQRCLINPNDIRCPICSQIHQEIYDKNEFMQRSKGDHDNFFAQLDNSYKNGDAFNTIAEYFGRGVIY